MFENIYLVSKNLRVADTADVDRLEQEIGMPLPHGYREYVTMLGSGEYCGELIVKMPDEVLTSLDEIRQLYAEIYEDSFLSYHEQPLTQ